MRARPVAAVLVLACAGCRPAPTGGPPSGPSPPANPTFASDVAPIIFQHCAGCHRPGESAPFPLLSYDDVREYLSPFSRLDVHKGDVSLALPHLPESRYRLVHIDTDLYQPTVDCLDYFGDRMSPGGVVVIDDYASRKCPGVPKAVSEYMARTDRFQTWDLRTEQLILIKV